MLIYQAPSTVSESFEDLISYLEEPLLNNPDRNKLLVRSILVWLGSQNLEHYSSMKAHTDSPAGFLAMLSLERTTFSTFFTVLCR